MWDFDVDLFSMLPLEERAKVVAEYRRQADEETIIDVERTYLRRKADYLEQGFRHIDTKTCSRARRKSNGRL